MITELPKELLQQTTMRIFEEAAFVFAEPMEQPMDWPDEVIEVKLHFAGPEKGLATLALTLDFASLLAANLLGVETDDPAVQQRRLEAAGEMLNILGGALFASWFGAAAECHVGIPQVNLVRSISRNGNGGESCCAVSLLADDEYRIDAGICIEG